METSLVLPHKNEYISSISDITPRGNVVYPTILHAIGNTPLVKLNRVPKDHGLECDIFAKCEFLNAGNSIKDRIARAMVADAQRRGRASPRTRLVAPTSGNTGVGLALAAAVEGYKCTIVTPDKNSYEKMNTMRLLGAEVITASSQLPFHHPDSYLSITERICQEDPDAICLDQYTSDVNPVVHYETTAEEILAALDDRVDMLVMGTGTGGTLTGVAYKVKQRCPTCVVVAVDPRGSVIFGSGPTKQYKVEGIGGDFIPDVLDKSIVDKVEAPDDKQSFNMAREIIRKEGLLCGGSSGAAMFATIQAAKSLGLGAGSRVVVVFADSIRNYMTKFVSDQWMEAFLFMDPPPREHLKWWNMPLSELKIPSAPLVLEDATLRDALKAMGDEPVAMVVDGDGFYKGVISKDSVRKAATEKEQKTIDFQEPVTSHLIKNCYQLVLDSRPTAGLASRVLDIAPFAVVLQQSHERDGHGELKFVPRGIVTTTTILDVIVKYST